MNLHACLQFFGIGVNIVVFFSTALQVFALL